MPIKAPEITMPVRWGNLCIATSAPLVTGIIASNCQGRNAPKDWYAGAMFASTFILITTPATALAAPSLPIVLAEIRNIIALTNGRAIVAITTAATGLGLKLKCSPLESGSTNMKIYQMHENHSEAKAGTSAVLAIV